MKNSILATILIRVSCRLFVAYMVGSHFHDWKWGLAAFCAMAAAGEVTR